MSLREAVAKMAAAATDQKVGLVIRWNRNDELIRTMWSEGSEEAANPANPPPDIRPLMFRYLDDDDRRGGIRATLKQADRAGYHAEELMIACWPWLLTQYDLTETEISTVELVLSKSPCSGGKGSSPLIVPDCDDKDILYETSCAKKLTRFCGERSDIRFKIYFLALAGAHAGKYALDTFWGPGVNRFMTAEERELDEARIALGRLGQQQGGFLKQAADEDTDFKKALARLQDPRTPRSEKLGLKGQLGARQKASKEYKRQAANLGRPIEELRGPARSVSLATAQLGIALLQSLFNIDVMRWDGGYEKGGEET